MTIDVDGIKYNVEVDEGNLASEKIPVIFLHGFTGSTADWQFIVDKLPERFYPVRYDQIGHGKTESPADIKYFTSRFKLRAVEKIRDDLKLKEHILCGYSMGGRAAYNYAMTNPVNFKGLIIESSTPGIEEAIQRIDKIKEDNEFAQKIETEGMVNFINFWYSRPFFASMRSLPADFKGKLIESRMNNNPIGLAYTLRGFSAGRMVSHWDNLSAVNTKVLLISGSLDLRYTMLAEKAAPRFKDAQHKIIENAGHNTHLEKPEEFINLVNDFLNSLN